MLYISHGLESLAMLNIVLDQVVVSYSFGVLP